MGGAAELQLVVAAEHMDGGRSAALGEARVVIRIHAVSAELTWLRSCLPWCPGSSAHPSDSPPARLGMGKAGSQDPKEKVELSLVR